MAPSNAARDALEPVVGGVRKEYTWGYVHATIVRLHEAKNSFRQIAKENFGGCVSHATIQRIYKGVEPHDLKTRQALGLPAYHQVVVVTGGDVPPGTLVISADQCVECQRFYISNHPRRKKCFICSPYRKQGGNQ
jgi:hypothetical protein